MRTAQIMARGTFPHNGQQVACEVIKFGSRLRIISKKTDRSINNKGYTDLREIRKEFPTAGV